MLQQIPVTRSAFDTADPEVAYEFLRRAYADLRVRASRHEGSYMAVRSLACGAFSVDDVQLPVHLQVSTDPFRRGTFLYLRGVRGEDGGGDLRGQQTGAVAQGELDLGHLARHVVGGGQDGGLGAVRHQAERQAVHGQEGQQFRAQPAGDVGCRDACQDAGDAEQDACARGAVPACLSAAAVRRPVCHRPRPRQSASVVHSCARPGSGSNMPFCRTVR